MADFRSDDMSGRVAAGTTVPTTADLRVYLFAGTIDPTPAQPTSVMMSEIVTAGGTLLATSTQLQNVVDTLGLISADSIDIANVTGTIVAVAIGVYTGTLGTTRVFRYFDAAIAGLPQTVNAQTVTLNLANGLATFQQA